ncbi:copper resistance CopC family protein [Promicromonospora sukumoe]|uniref:copper resistance CopC family protein n=1 Tax=Promicromonospora sukumoe TaxID=88382 RepID=UPI00039B3D6E|nr:copper resistance CopC family protein [Promicromonospora sukumoe]
MPRFRPLVGGTAVAVVALLATAAPASAHDKLVASDPTSDQTLAEAPATVSLTYSAEVLDMGAAVVVTDGDGTDWVSDAPAIDGATVTAALDADMPDGGYEIRWRVVSSDGHPITGIVPFAVGDGEEPGAGSGSAGQAGDDAAASEPAASAPADDAAADAATPNSSQNQTAQEDEGPWRVVLVGAGGAAVAAALFALVHFLRRRSDASGPGDDGDTPDAPGTK